MRSMSAFRCLFLVSASPRALNAQTLHQAFHCAAGYLDILPVHLPPDLADTVDLEVLLPDPLDIDREFKITLGSVRQTIWVSLPGFVLIEG